MAWKKSGSLPPRPAPLATEPAGEPAQRLGPTRLPALAPDPPGGAAAGALVLPAALFFHGDLSGAADLVIEGRFEGTISLPENQVRVSSGGRVKADVRGRVIVVEGEVEGDLTAGDQVLVAASGAVRGNLKAPRVTLADGARFRGKIEMEGEA